MKEEKKEAQPLVMGLSNVTMLQQSSVMRKSSHSVNIRKVGSSLYITNQPRAKAEKNELSDAQLRGLKSEKYAGQVTSRIKKIILSTCQNWRDTLDYMNGHLTPGQWRERKEIVLITLTLSAEQKHDDKYIKRHLLNSFLIGFLRAYPRANYLWKAEKQKNGNLHFHLLTDVYVEKSWLQRRWNVVQSYHGYHPTLPNDENEIGLPSTRVEGLRDKNNAIAYIAKYLSKDEGDSKIDGRVWACNKGLRELKVITLQVEKDTAVMMCESLMTPKTNVLTYDYVTIITNINSQFYIKDFCEIEHMAKSRLIFNAELLANYYTTNSMFLTSEEWFLELERDSPGDVYNNR